MTVSAPSMTQHPGLSATGVPDVTPRRAPGRVTASSSVASGLDPLNAALRHNSLGDFTAMSPEAACLLPLLRALEWRGDTRDIAEALPHFADTLDLVDLRNVLVALGYETTPEKARLSRIDARHFPCLMAPSGGGCIVVKSVEGGTAEIYDGRTDDTRRVPARQLRGTCYLLTETQVEAGIERGAPGSSWFADLIKRFRSTGYALMVLSLIVNLLALASPIFIMIVYDKVIGARSVDTLGYLAAGIAVIFVAEIGLKLIRARVVSSLAGRLDYVFGVEAFRQILGLPPTFTERSSVGSQVARIREFESVRDFFSGPLAAILLELPFLIIFIGMMAVIGGIVAIVPVIMVVCFVLFGWYWLPGLKDAVAKASKARAERQVFVVETLSSLRAIKAFAAEPTWRERYRTLSANAVSASYQTSKKTIVLQTVAQALMTIASIAVLGLGVLQALSGALTVGGLIATMTLVFRVLGPLQAGFLAFTRFEQVRLGIRQINQLMALKPERNPSRTPLLRRQLSGQITFNRISFRYAQESDPALLGASFQVQPGEMVAVTGHNGSGKSTVLKLVAGLYQPQAGTLQVDGQDIRQFDPVELRRMIAYVPQVPHLFHGTIAQNLRLADPTASDEALARAAAEAGVLQAILEMPKGFDSRIGDNSTALLPRGFIQRLVVARAVIRKSPILLLDEPASALDEIGDNALVRLLQRMHGRATILMVSHRPSHIKLADRVVVLDHGTIRFIGNPDEALAMMQSAGQ